MKFFNFFFHVIILSSSISVLSPLAVFSVNHLKLIFTNSLEFPISIMTRSGRFITCKTISPHTTCQLALVCYACSTFFIQVKEQEDAPDEHPNPSLCLDYNKHFNINTTPDTPSDTPLEEALVEITINNVTLPPIVPGTIGPKYYLTIRDTQHQEQLLSF
jgi:hypothetical protein